MGVDLEIVARDGVGNETDITEAVRVCFDTALGSMDYGSGMLDLAEMNNLKHLATACHFDWDPGPCVRYWRHNPQDFRSGEKCGHALADHGDPNAERGMTERCRVEGCGCICYNASR